MVRAGRQPPEGRLVLVVGPSGAGKDTLLAAAQRKFADDPRIVFPRRVITRAEGIGEAHVAVSRREFERRAQAGEFFLSWHAHGLRYGIPGEAGNALRAGRIVVVNISRDVVAEASALWPQTRVVHVTVALEALKARLDARGRETAVDIAARIARASLRRTLPPNVTDTIDNSGHLSVAVRKFNALIALHADAKR